jgi:hypothetical protein
MSTTELTRTPRTDATDRVTERARVTAVVAAGAIAALYLAIFAGLLSVGRAETGELGILGVAGGLFAAIAVALWSVRRRSLWAAVGVLQLLLAAMYVGVAPDRDPAYEVWGLSIRALSLVLLVAVVTLFVRSRRTRDQGGAS